MTSLKEQFIGGGDNSSIPVRDDTGYNYGMNIATPTQMGMTKSGEPGSLASNMNGILQYVDLLIEGTGPGSKHFQDERLAPNPDEWDRKSRAQIKDLVKKGRKPLGNRYFMNTGAKCDCGGTEEDRYSLINNIPDGNLPGMSQVSNGKAGMFRGLIPGTIEGILAINPMGLFEAIAGAATGNNACTNVGAGSPYMIKEVLQKFVRDDVGRNKAVGGKHVTIAPNGKRCVLNSELKRLPDSIWPRKDGVVNKPALEVVNQGEESFTNMNKILKGDLSDITKILETPKKIDKTTTAYFVMLAALIGLLILKLGRYKK